jgi:hypothetical protein
MAATTVVAPAPPDQLEAEQTAGRHPWDAMMLTPRLDVCRSILRGLPVLAGSLDGVILSHALRGAELPPVDNYITVTGDMLDAVDEAGPYNFTPKRGRRRR